MPLLIDLKPGEKVIVNGAVVENAGHSTKLRVLNDSNILREKDIMTAATANTPAKRIYLAVQLMYLSRSIETTQDDYLTFVRELIEASPSSTPIVMRISSQILAGNLYKAMKEARTLIEYEGQILSQAAGGLVAAPAVASGGE